VNGLLLQCAHPQTATQLRADERSLLVAARKHPAVICTRFSFEMLQWLLARTDVRVDLYGIYGAPSALNDLLRCTLPSAERGLATMGMSPDEWFAALGIAPRNRVRFIVEQAALITEPLTRDVLVEALDLWVEVKALRPSFSLAMNRLPVTRVFYHENAAPALDPQTAMQQALPRPRALTTDERVHVIDVVRATMALTVRETDTSTYANVDSVRVYDLDRGISVAIYDMVPHRQMALESYVGYTLFKNGFPAAYGGAWIFGRRANLGISVFEPYRGGESAFMMAQVMRVYRHVFTIDHIEIEPTQYGKDEPDGLKSGAFWFYYKFGFRPTDKGLAELARAEQQRRAARAGYRSSLATLKRFTASTMAVQFAKVQHIDAGTAVARITAHINKAYRGDRQRAVTDSVARLCATLGLSVPRSATVLTACADLALLCEALRITDRERLRSAYSAAQQKPRNMVRYQALVRALLV
jgi:hypothetical protein